MELKDPPSIKDLSKKDTSLSVSLSSVVQNPTTETLVFQTNPNVVAADVMFASPAKIRYCHSGREYHPLVITEFFDDIFGLQEDFFVERLHH